MRVWCAKSTEVPLDFAALAFFGKCLWYRPSSLLLHLPGVVELLPVFLRFRWTGHCFGRQGQVHGGTPWSGRDRLLLVCILIIIVVHPQQTRPSGHRHKGMLGCPSRTFVSRLVSCRQSYVFLLVLIMRLQQVTLFALLTHVHLLTPRRRRYRKCR